MYKNRVELEGFLGTDPELRHLPSGDAVANVRLATKESWKDAGGTIKWATEWHSLVIYGVLAETVSKHWRKGDNIAAEGKIQTRFFGENKAKAAREIVVFRAHRIDRLPGGDATDDQAGENMGRANDTPAKPDNWPRV